MIARCAGRESVLASTRNNICSSFRRDAREDNTYEDNTSRSGLFWEQNLNFRIRVNSVRICLFNITLGKTKDVNFESYYDKISGREGEREK